MIVCLGTTPTLARTMEFESIAVDGVSRARRTYEYAAGKAVNAARAITTLGEQAAIVGVAGGATGERLRALAATAAAQQEFVKVTAPTRLCITAIDQTAGTSSELIEESGELPAADGERILAALAGSLGGTSGCVLAGSLAPGLNVDFYARCIRLCKVDGVPCVLDASGAALRSALDEGPAVIKINAGELASVETVADDSDEAVTKSALALARRTAGWVIVTRGMKPTIAAHATKGVLTASVPTVRIVSPIGSGDSFAGGLATGMARGLEMSESLKLATACASANAMTADAAHFDLNTVETLRAAIVVR